MVSLEVPIQYQPFFCEENIWKLVAESLPQVDGEVILISNAEQAFALNSQRAGGDAGVVMWDYHVVFLMHDEDGQQTIWDLDTTLGYPVAASTWCDQSLGFYLADWSRGEAGRRQRDWLPATPVYRSELTEIQPMFRVIPVVQYRTQFSSDRRHMKAEDGGWLQELPPWKAIGEGHRLAEWLGFEHAEPGRVLNLPEFFGDLFRE